MTNLFTLQLMRDGNEANLMVIRSIAHRMFNAIERLAVLNLETSRAGAEYAANGLRRLQDTYSSSTMSLLAEKLPSPAEAAVTYLRNVHNISSAVQGEVTKVMAERTGEATDAIAEILDEVVRPLAEPLATAASTMVKSGASNARSAYDSVAETAIQAVEANYSEKVAEAVAPTRKASSSAKKRKAT